MTTQEKSSLTGPEILMVVFSHEKEGVPSKHNLVMVENILPFIRGLTVENTNSQIFQNPVRLCTLYSSKH